MYPFIRQEKKVVQSFERILKTLASKLLQQGLSAEKVAHLTNMPLGEVQALGEE